MTKLEKITKTVEFADLPSDVRHRFVPGRPVTVIYEGEMAEPALSPEDVERRRRSILKYWGVAAHRKTSSEEAVARIRALRDEWD